MTADGSYRSLGPPLDLSSVGNRPVSKNRISSGPGTHLARANHGQSRSFSGPSSTSDEDDDSAVVFDKNTRTFIRTSRSRRVEPSSPESPKAQVVYDPHTRSLVSRQEGRGSDSPFTVTPVQPDMVSSPEHRPRIVRNVEPENGFALRPPPKNPARLFDSARPTSPRTPQVLHKQPSVVREDSEAERQAEASSTTSNDTRDAPQTVSVIAAPVRTYATPTAPHQRSASLEPPLITGAGRGREASASPSRSPHFSASPVSKVERHDPPPRGVSPVKSALKHSPASSERAASPIANFLPAVAANTTIVSPPSETTDGSPSQDGLDSGKKKKSTRVSFDERAQEIEVPAAAAVPAAIHSFEEEDDDDAVMKPRPALPSFGSIRRNRMQPELVEKVTEMPPERHETSSDHAIGGILRNNLEPLPPEVTSKETADYASDESSETEVPAVSAAANPEPAKVGAGLESRREGSEPIIKDFADAPAKSERNQRAADDADVPAINLLPPTPGTEDDSKKDFIDQEDDHKEFDEQEDSFQARAKARNSMEIVVPGGWGEDDDNETEDGKAEESSTAASDPQASSADQTDTLSPVLHASPLQLSDIDEDSDDSAEFSDAVEDPEDLEDGGFASLDAIVESPMAPHSPADAQGKSRTIATREPPESPTVQPVTKKPENADPSPAGNWGEATTYWSQLSKEKREQMERQHMSSDDDERPAPNPLAMKKPKATKPVTDTKLTTLPVAKSPKQAPSAVQREPVQPTMRKSMRAQTGPAPVSTRPDDGVHMRSSMRSGGRMSPSLRSGGPPRRPQSEYVEPRGTLQKKNLRPMSSTSIASSSSGSMMQTQQPASASGAKGQDSSFPSLPTKKGTPQRRAEPPKVSAKLQRELAKADDSDSESSFKRRRRGNSGSTLESTGRYNMRRSMRGASVDETPAPVEQRPQSPDVGGRGKSGFRIRSLSPFGRKKVEAAPIPTGPRTTLRSAPAGKSGGASATPPSRAAPPTAPRYKSRFADSDDSDEEAAPSRSFFKSKFVDSDDDEPRPSAAPSGLTPVRGIPRRPGQDDGDSTDLEDEDDDGPGKSSKSRRKVAPIVTNPADVEKAMAAARRNLGISEESAPKRQPTNEGSTLAKGSLRNRPAEVTEDKPVTAPQPESPVVTTPEKKKRGFMNSILRRNRNSASSVQQIRPTSPPPAVPTSPATAVKPSPPDDKQTSPDTPSSPSSPSVGKLIRRRSDQPAMARLNSDYSIATAPPTSQDTTLVATQNDEHWPLPSPSIPPIPPIPADLAAGAAARPDTSEGFSPEAIKLAQSLRPDLAPRSKSGPQRSVRIQAGEEGSEPGEREKDLKAIYSRRTGKKKKFGMLRRAFGIDD